jgi:PAS domain S-box-containing protein
MLDLPALKMSEYALELLQTPVGILGWLFWLLVILIFAFRCRKRDLKLDRKTLIWLAVLSLGVLLFTPFFGISLTPDALDSESTYQLMLFAALPWLVAGGVLGALPAVVVAGLSGVLMAYLQTQHIFTPLIFMTAALIFSCCIWQRYRTFIFKLLRFPLAAAIVSALAVIPLQFIALVLNASGKFQTRILQGMNTLPSEALIFVGSVVIGGFLCIFVKMAAGSAWGNQDPLKPSPGEKSLRFRVLSILMLVLVVFSAVLLVTRWTSAVNEVRRDAINTLTSTSGIVSEGLSVYIDTGEDLIARFATDDRLVTQDPDAVSQVLAQKMNYLPYFDFLVVLNLNGEVVAAYPTGAAVDANPEVAEMVSQQSIMDKIQIITTTTPADDANTASLTNFLVRINDSANTAKGILWGQARLEDHFIMMSAVEDLKSFSNRGGIGQIIGNDGTVVYRLGAKGGSGTYTGSRYPTATFIEGRSLDGQSVMEYYRPVGDTGWAVVTSLPIQILQSRTLEIVYPSVIFGVALIFLALLVVSLVLSPVEKSLRKLETAAKSAASGDFKTAVLDDEIPLTGVGMLGNSVRNLISSLQKYPSNQSDLLTLNQQLSEQLSLNESLKIILLSALERGLSSARILMTDGGAKAESAVLLNHIGLGQHTNAMAPLDEDILALIQERGELVLRDFQIGKLVNVRKEMPYPSSIIALPLEWKGSKKGVFWGTFHNGRYPETSDINFLKDLSEKAAQIVIKAQDAGEFLKPHVELDVVLNALNDPVFITDSYGRIVLHNEAAKFLTDDQQRVYEGKMLSSMFNNEPLLTLFQKAEEHRQSMELQFPDGKTYHVIAHPALLEGQQMGVVAWFKDITPYKKKDALKNEFVTTTSHELRTPLTLIHGYAKILRLTGNLNEQQDKYVKNIVDSVEEMRNLVQNLLSLSRLEAGEALALSEATTDHIVQSVVEGLEAQATQKNIHLETSSPKSPISFTADLAFLKLALRNLVENAIKFTKMGGDVTLSVRKQENDLIFEVQDTGIGIAPLDQQHIFDKFHRVSHGGDDIQQGSGLGLAIVKSIADRHQGKVWVESQLGKGSTFYLQIPITHS